MVDQGALPPDDRTPALQLGASSGVWLALGVLGGSVLLGLLRTVPDALTKVAVGVLIAFALDPLVLRVRVRFRCSRAAAVGVVGSVLVVVLGFLLIVLGPRAIDQAGQFGRELPETVEGLYELPVIGGYLERNDASDKVQQWVDDLPARIDQQTVSDLAERVVGGVMSTIVVLIIGIAVLVDGDRLVNRILAAIPDRIETGAVRAGRIFYKTIGAYFSGSLLVAACTATFILTLGLALGVPLAPAAALWALVVNLIPQVGGFLTGTFFAILGFAESPTTGVICALAYLAWMNFENHVLQPAIVGEAVQLSPPTTMLAALVGGAAAGVPGALVATPLCGAAKAIYRLVRYGDEPPSDPRPSRKLIDRLRPRHHPATPTTPATGPPAAGPG